MTLIPFQDGKPVMRDGKIGTGQECCCGGIFPCTCAASCSSGNMTLVCDGNPEQLNPLAPCLEPNPPQRPGPYWQAGGNHSGNLRSGCESSANSASLECIDGQWIITAYEAWCCDGESLRQNIYTATPPCDETGLPVPGEVVLQFVETVIVGDMWCDDAAPEGTPVVSITRP